MHGIVSYHITAGGEVGRQRCLVVGEVNVVALGDCVHSGFGHNSELVG